MDKKNLKQLVIWGLGFLLLLTLFNGVKTVPLEAEIPYSEFKTRLREGAITQVRMRPDMISGDYRDAKGATKHFRTLPLPDPKLVEDLEAHKVSNFQGERDHSGAYAFALNLGGILLFFFLWWFFVIRQVQVGGKQALSFGRSKAKLVDESRGYARPSPCTATRGRVRGSSIRRSHRKIP